MEISGLGCGHAKSYIEYSVNFKQLKKIFFLYRTSTYGGSETTLTILGFDKNNSGAYTCVATNQYGEAQQNLFLDIASNNNFLNTQRPNFCLKNLLKL